MLLYADKFALSRRFYSAFEVKHDVFILTARTAKKPRSLRGVFVKQLILPMVYDHREDFSLFTGKAQYRTIYQPGCIEVRSYLFDKLEFGKLTFKQIILSNINTLFVFKSKLYNPRH